MDKMLFVVSFGGNSMYICAEPQNKEGVLSLTRYGVIVRLGTAEDHHEINLIEQEMEFHEDDIVRDWEEDEGAILLTVKDWE